ncbi:U6 snRNA-associated Sm-like protein LSm6 [Babesia microti strain RI]|uniref:U6 snRNA-associated Sm-like protein LSm6 n=1 Tax=Babesia microti (strain RI) TaxID=1133968 RepID=A0A1R4AB70_BABMR|nr:U6 snRNA-associated Sm-like protein LSm6 [Babesia microti strain RI]SJK86262.1 U6 snRNA-associated Sm-like protein LSm6 [Babesia microti strain RI]|eukprot:XP_021338442.1 U6 snRNA-associated Sm-like protein LSm6 [Babesia microti strain RI]
MANASPSSFITSVTRNPVVVRLNNGSNFKGILACLDERMNISMENTKEYINGVLVKEYGDSFIRGNNVLYIRTDNDG